MKITNSEQFEKLVGELENNPCLAKGFKKGTVPNNFNQQWENIAVKLNASGPPSRDADGWQKVWRDLKFKVKKKLVHNKAECRATGGGRNKEKVLSPLEETVADILQFGRQVSPEGLDFGVEPRVGDLQAVVESVDLAIPHEADIYLEDMLSEEEERPTTSRATIPSSSAIPPTNGASQNAMAPVAAASFGKKKSSDRQNLLEKHNNMQEKVLTDISNTLMSIKRSIKDSCRFQEKRLEVEQKKLKLMQKKEMKDNEEHAKEMELKPLKIKIIQKELDILNRRN